ncbi:MAG TPA: M48 family metalloprotease, partial [Bryobacteraceae bacterium]
MRRLLGLAVVSAFTLAPYAGYAADTKSSDTPNATDQTTTDTKKDEKKNKNKKKDPDEIGNRDVSKGANFYSLEKEIALGKQLAQEVEHQAKIIDDPIIAEYVNRVGQNIVRNSDAKVPFTIKVLEDESVNAFALPGGFFFVNTGLILKADNEAELAGVMAHEIAHVAARHGTRQATKAELANYMSIPLIFMGGWAGYGIRQAAGFLVPM